MPPATRRAQRSVVNETDQAVKVFSLYPDRLFRLCNFSKYQDKTYEPELNF